MNFIRPGMGADWEGWGCPKETGVTPRGNLHKIRFFKDISLSFHVEDRCSEPWPDLTTLAKLCKLQQKSCIFQKFSNEQGES